MNEDLFEQIQLFLPKYLTPTTRTELFEEIARFPDIRKSFYLANRESAQPMLQGDAWRGFVVVDFDTAAKRPVSGLILSNSCDINPENPRDVPPRVLFSPLVSLERFIGRLRQAGETNTQIDSKMDGIRKQYVTSIFYLPPENDVVKESMILFDDIHAHPSEDFLARERSRIFSLSQFAFYLLLIKLSIHFCRSNEGRERA